MSKIRLFAYESSHASSTSPSTAIVCVAPSLYAVRASVNLGTGDGVGVGLGVAVLGGFVGAFVLTGCEGCADGLMTGACDADG